MTVRSALRIAIAPGPADRRRLLGMAAGVAVGVMLAALLWAGFTGLGDRSERSTWVSPHSNTAWTPETQLSADQVAARGSTDMFDGQAISVVHAYGADDTTVSIPGIPDGVPAGTSWVSPALAELIEQTPSDQLGDRFGTVKGTLPNSVLAGPDSLVAVVGVDDSRVNEAFSVLYEFEGFRYTSDTYEAIALLGAVAVLIPVLMLLGVVTSFGSIDRTARMRALHLLGATAADRARFAAVEAGAVALVGSIVGVLLAWLAAIPASLVSINGSRLFPDDLRLEPWEGIVAIVVVPLAFAVVAAVRAARADAQPSSVRDRPEKPLSLWRLAVPFGGALLMFAGLFATRYAEYVLVTGFAVTAIGIVMVGPILTRNIARLAHRRAQSVAGLMAYARIQRHPRQIFRAVSGVVIAVFLVSLFMSGVTSVRGGGPGGGDGYLADDVLIVQLDDQMGWGAQGGASDAENEEIVAAIERMDGVTGVARTFMNDRAETLSTREELAKVGIASDADVSMVQAAPFDVPVVQTSGGDLSGAKLSTVFIATTDANVRERVRTFLAENYDSLSISATPAEQRSFVDSSAEEYRTLAILGIIVAAGVSAVALAAATISAVRDRRRTLGLMRLTGMPFSAVKGIMLREAVVPLAAAVALAALTGYGVGALIVTGLSAGGRTVTAPPLEYYIVIAATLGLSLLAVLAAFPAVRRATGGEATRFE
ncbi:FtsX-like permease family protein [Microbacterium sp. YY-03]|uniref:FtsX-like permease family protein n=1 Tax=Microbacterium sp. YY-03 TaxID=3421636 RepID=UPI003D17B4C9